jgi:hypothetical protein
MLKSVNIASFYLEVITEKQMSAGMRNLIWLQNIWVLWRGTWKTQIAEPEEAAIDKKR